MNPISLEDLNARAALQARCDNKYIADSEAVERLLEALAPTFSVLEIGHRRTFRYESRYFDNQSFRGYYDHHQGRRRRFKIRTRKYVDSGLEFLEIKLKSVRGLTVKKRIPYSGSDQVLSPEAQQFVESTLAEFYNMELSEPLVPTLDLSYRRTTLVCNESNERVTMDNAVTFSSSSIQKSVPRNMWIIETKSKNGHGECDKILRQLHSHPIKKCSKYCLGLGLTGQVTKTNRFLPVIRKFATPQIAHSDLVDDDEIIIPPHHLASGQLIG